MSRPQWVPERTDAPGIALAAVLGLASVGLVRVLPASPFFSDVLIALVLGVLPSIPGFLKSAGFLSGPKNFFDELYVYAWFVGVAVASVLYLALMRLMPARKPFAAT